jgi:rSAM/selenodomain-associated transferase 2
MSASTHISVIFPVLNEPEDIARLLAHLASLPADTVPEIIVVDGDPKGSTINAVKQEGVVTALSPAGRGPQMNAGAEKASGDILLFLHADTFLPWNAFELIRRRMENGRCDAGAFDLGILSDRMIFRITERYAACRTRLTRVPFGDQAIFVRKEYFREIGGFRSIPIMEDVELMSRIKKRGGRTCIIPEKVMTSARRWERDGIVRGTIRNWVLQILYCCGVPPERLARFYRP